MSHSPNSLSTFSRRLQSMSSPMSQGLVWLYGHLLTTHDIPVKYFFVIILFLFSPQIGKFLNPYTCRKFIGVFFVKCCLAIARKVPIFQSADDSDSGRNKSMGSSIFLQFFIWTLASCVLHCHHLHSLANHCKRICFLHGLQLSHTLSIFLWYVSAAQYRTTESLATNWRERSHH